MRIFALLLCPITFLGPVMAAQFRNGTTETPSPWALRGAKVIAPQTGEVIADLRPRSRLHRNWRDDGMKMAAAPDLLDVARLAAKGDVNPAALTATALAALAKAGQR